MAYIDQRTGGNQRWVTLTAVALIQGAVGIALINGLAVKWIERPAPTRTEGEQIKLEPIPQPEPTPIEHPKTETRTQIDNPARPVPLPPIEPYDTLPPTPPMPNPLPTASFDPPKPPAPEPTQAFTPRGAKPRNAPGTWATSSDYPARDLREGNQGVVGFLLNIDADGRVQSCAVTQSSGFPGLDKATCDNVSRRARFEPATNGDGNRVAGSYRGNIRWQIPQD